MMGIQRRYFVQFGLLVAIVAFSSQLFSATTETLSTRLDRLQREASPTIESTEAFLQTATKLQEEYSDPESVGLIQYSIAKAVASSPLGKKDPNLVIVHATNALQTSLSVEQHVELGILIGDMSTYSIRTHLTTDTSTVKRAAIRALLPALAQARWALSSRPPNLLGASNSFDNSLDTDANGMVGGSASSTTFPDDQQRLAAEDRGRRQRLAILAEMGEMQMRELCRGDSDAYAYFTKHGPELAPMSRGLLEQIAARINETTDSLDKKRIQSLVENGDR